MGAVILLTHAVAFMTHEYAHALTAWALGWKADPLALNYGPATLANILFQQGIDENVDYGPIFASYHGLDAALIAFAGAGIGNGLFYFIYAAALRHVPRHRPYAEMILFWLAVMSAGNVWSYAPTRALAGHADMALLAQGLGLSRLAMFPLVTIPALAITWHFFTRCAPDAMAALRQNQPDRLILTASLASFFYFGFFGGSAVGGNYGDPAALFSIASILILLPLSTLYLVKRSDPDRA
ncbi:hypothetical protein Tasa_059_001 [Tanticharoenia sakaeratensis NBRC 103193]|uniref:Peptidase M50 n=2 Tax=Tanticharoenia TaxID=444052 RepID=A0A0D6MQW8_9PROT|nr:hypothetical protein Tasa_059_001 [Tanticharoenia sakaeratensis NBRC 103193]GBQ21577.1 hypothetical protein AA103193_1772 [Tanticharoenia sakaeratensis NBRC 103193]